MATLKSDLEASTGKKFAWVDNIVDSVADSDSLLEAIKTEFNNYRASLQLTSRARLPESITEVKVK